MKEIALEASEYGMMWLGFYNGEVSEEVCLQEILMGGWLESKCH